MNRGIMKGKGIISGLWVAVWLNALFVTSIITIMINFCVSFIPEPQRVTFNFWIYGGILSCIYTMLNLILSIIISCETKKRLPVILIVDIISVLLCFLVGTKYDNRIIWFSFLCFIYYPLHINNLGSTLDSKKGDFFIFSALGKGIISFVIIMTIMYIKIPWYRLFIIIDTCVFILLWLLSCFWIRSKHKLSGPC